MRFPKVNGARRIVHNRKFVPENRFSGPKNDMFAKESSVWQLSSRQVGNAKFRRAERDTGFRASDIHLSIGHPLEH